AVSDDVGQSGGFAGIIELLAFLNVFVGVFNLFPLLPLDGGHAAIATYERARDGRTRSRYHADVARLVPLTMAVVAMLAFMFMSGLYLDIVNPIG
ncbi:MAG: site-2 protease family protein, partial [Actinomycetota bacterium]|nr:site-2 protease family protein [Actinomycetota bacterium]